MAEPNPSNVAPWYLRNINEALELDPITGNVFVRTGITGNVINSYYPESIFCYCLVQ
jgi:hypothetical protein